MVTRYATYRCDDCKKTRTVVYEAAVDAGEEEQRKWDAIKLDHRRVSPRCAEQSHSGIRVESVAS